jgi:hypothetical protein
MVIGLVSLNCEACDYMISKGITKPFYLLFMQGCNYSIDKGL